jgi:poly-gamma-glutamate capsule biosynthesis protein CapA/YwtB (metallophosphatase superfamily)
MPGHYAVYFKDAGFDMVSTANNHSGDFGEVCRAQTEALLDAQGIAHSGRPGDIARLSVKGLKLAMIAFHTSAATHDVRDIDTARALVRSLTASHDIIIVSFHGGAEGARAIHLPQGRETFYGEDRGDLRQFSHAVIDAGADLVLGHGPHVLRGMEVYKERLIAYSLGNFATYGRFTLRGPNGLGLVLEATLSPDGRFLAGQLHPTKQVGAGTPTPDPEGAAIDMVRMLSGSDFQNTGILVAQDGSIIAQ